jgi:hypothetical protein
MRLAGHNPGEPQIFPHIHRKEMQIPQQSIVAKQSRKSKKSRGFREYLNACATKPTSELFKRRRALRPQIADAMSELGAVESELKRRNFDDDL